MIQKLSNREKQLIRFQKQIIENFKNYVEIFFRKLPQPSQKLFELIQRTDEYSMRLKYNIEKKMTYEKIMLTEINNNLEKLNPIQVIIKQLDYIKNLNTRFNGAVTLYFEKTKNKILRIDDILKSISPISTLDRGYAIVTDHKTKKIIKNANRLKIGKKIHVKLASSEIDSTVDKIYEK